MRIQTVLFAKASDHVPHLPTGSGERLERKRWVGGAHNVVSAGARGASILQYRGDGSTMTSTLVCPVEFSLWLRTSANPLCCPLLPSSCNEPSFSSEPGPFAHFPTQICLLPNLFFPFNLTSLCSSRSLGLRSLFKKLVIISSIQIIV